MMKKWKVWGEKVNIVSGTPSRIINNPQIGFSEYILILNVLVAKFGQLSVKDNLIVSRTEMKQN